MPQFRKKPVVIEAVQFIGTNYREIQEFCPSASFAPSFLASPPDSKGNVIIPTLEGDHTGNIGDWIIKGVKGEFYPCKPDIFDSTYDKV